MEKDRIIVKVGSLAVTCEEGGVSLSKIENLIFDLFTLKENQKEIILVSSGAIHAAKGLIPYNVDKKLKISHQQALAAVGQPLLMNAYQEVLKKYNWKLAQILVTHEDFKDRKRLLNIRNTINTLLKEGILPIVNENDTVSYEEITVGDNDQLAVMMVQATEGNKLIILSETEGLYNKNPKEKDAILIKNVAFNSDLKNIKFGAKTSAGRGGMSTKLQAIMKLTPQGVDVFLGSFLQKNPVSGILNNLQGTKFEGNPNREDSFFINWMRSLVKNHCYLVIDEGAKNALMKGQNSLLPVGIKKVVGIFKRGDVLLINHKGKSVAMGLSEFSQKEILILLEEDSIEKNELLMHSKVVVHKNNLALL